MKQATPQSTTRRALLSAAPTIAAVAAVPATALAASDDGRAAVAELDRCVARCGEVDAGHLPPEEYSPVFAWEDRIYFQPCNSLGAAVAKLTMLGLSFERGHRSDETEGEVLAEVVAYLRGRL